MGEITLMAQNDFKAFAADANANVLSQAEYEALAALLSGFSAGKASSAQVNKALRQATSMAAMIGGLIAASGVNAKDDGNTDSLRSNFVSALRSMFLTRDNNLSEIAVAGPAAQAASRLSLGLGGVAYANQVLLINNNLQEISLEGAEAQNHARLNLGGVPTKAETYLSNNNLSEIAVAGTAAQADARKNLGLNGVAFKSEVLLKDNNLTEIAVAGPAAQSASRTSLGLGSSATRDVGIAGGQIPDMSAFASSLGSAGSLNGSGYIRLPGGYIRQWGTLLANASGDVIINFPIAFAVKPDAMYFGCRQNSSPTALQSIIINDAASDNTKATCRAYKIDGSGTISGSTSAFYWVAEGKI